jgi:hypothetical protein
MFAKVRYASTPQVSEKKQAMPAWRYSRSCARGPLGFWNRFRLDSLGPQLRERLDQKAQDCRTRQQEVIHHRRELFQAEIDGLLQSPVVTLVAVNA